MTFAPKFDKTTTPAIFELAQSSASQSLHIVKLLSGAPSNAEAFPNATQVQMDLLLTNQHIIIANQTEFQAHQQALERRIDKMENLMLQILKALQKGKGNQ